MQYAFRKSGYNQQDWEHFNWQYAPPYDALRLIAQIRQYAQQQLTDPSIIGVLGITSKDIYSGEESNNFLFGLYDRHIAVMSLHRFITPGATNSVVINRAVMQGLSLAEQDAKQPHLCFECIRNINTVYQSFK